MFKWLTLMIPFHGGQITTCMDLIICIYSVRMCAVWISGDCVELRSPDVVADTDGKRYNAGCLSTVGRVRCAKVVVAVPVRDHNHHL